MRAACVLAILLVATSASAQTAREREAKQYFDLGKQAVDKGQFLVSITAFEEAYRLAPRASVIYALAFSYRAQWKIDRDDAKLRRAVALFHEYQGQSKQDRKDKVEAYLAELEPALAEVDAAIAAKAAESAPPAADVAKTAIVLTSRVARARVVFDGAAPVDLPAVIETTPGKHRMLAFAVGYDTDEGTVFAVEGQSVTVEVSLPELPTAVTVRGQAGARVAVDGVVVGRTGQSLSLAAGEHRISVLARGRRLWQTDLELLHGGEVTLDAHPRTSMRRRVAQVLFGTSIALAGWSGLAAALAVVAEHDAQYYLDIIASGDSLKPGYRDHYNEALDRRNWRRDGAIGLAAGALLTAGLATYLYFQDTPRLDGYAPGLVTPEAGGALFTLTRSF